MTPPRPTGRRAGRRRRRGGRLIWPMLGLAAVGTAAMVLTSRRRPSLRPAAAADTDTAAAGSRPAAEAASPEIAASGAQPADLPGSWVAGPAGNLYVRDSGAAPLRQGETAVAAGVPILFVHGLAGQGGQWAAQLDRLGHDHRVLALDLRGHGESDPADDGIYDMAGFAADVAAAADHFALRRFVLVGHSMGAAVAVAYAGAHPERVAGLLLVDPNGDPTRLPPAQVEPWLAAMQVEPRRELTAYFRQLTLAGDRAVARQVLAGIDSTCEEAIAPAVAAAMRYSPLAVLGGWRGPLLAVISEMNSLPYSLHRLLPDIPVEILRHAGHWLMMDRPGPFNEILCRFAASL